MTRDYRGEQVMTSIESDGYAYREVYGNHFRKELGTFGVVWARECGPPDFKPKYSMSRHADRVGYFFQSWGK